MDYKYNLGQKVKVNSIVKVLAEITDRLSKPGINLYQVEILEGKYKEKRLWFAEHELKID